MTATYKSAQSPVRGCSYSQVFFVAMVFSVVSAAAVVTAVIVVDIVIVVCCLLYVVCCLIFRDFRKNLFSKFFFLMLGRISVYHNQMSKLIICKSYIFLILYTCSVFVNTIYLNVYSMHLQPELYGLTFHSLYLCLLPCYSLCK